MVLYKQTEDITVIGVQVKTFPQGIKEAFDGLITNLGSDRAYYGVSWMDETDNIQYYAMARENFEDEASQWHYEHLVLEKGNYNTEAIHNWMNKTDCIKDVFHNLMGDGKPGKNCPCIEWYQSQEEMLCMVKIE